MDFNVNKKARVPIFEISGCVCLAEIESNLLNEVPSVPFIPFHKLHSVHQETSLQEHVPTINLWFTVISIIKPDHRNLFLLKGVSDR